VLGNADSRHYNGILTLIHATRFIAAEWEVKLPSEACACPHPDGQSKILPENAGIVACSATCFVVDCTPARFDGYRGSYLWVARLLDRSL